MACRPANVLRHHPADRSETPTEGRDDRQQSSLRPDRARDRPDPARAAGGDAGHRRGAVERGGLRVRGDPPGEEPARCSRWRRGSRATSPTARPPSRSASPRSRSGRPTTRPGSWPSAVCSSPPPLRWRSRLPGAARRSRLAPTPNASRAEDRGCMRPPVKGVLWREPPPPAGGWAQAPRDPRITSRGTSWDLLPRAAPARVVAPDLLVLGDDALLDDDGRLLDLRVAVLGDELGAPPVDVFVDDRARRLPPGRDGLRHGPRPRRPRAAIDGLTLTAIVTRADGVENTAAIPSRPGRRRPRAGAADRPGRPARRLAPRGPRRPRGPAARDRDLPRRGLHPRARRPRAHPARGPVDPPRRPGRGPRRLPLGRPRRRSRARGRDPRRHGPRRRRVRPASSSASRTSPSRPATPRCRRRPPTRPAPRGSRFRSPATGPVSRPLDLTATLRVRDGSGRPVERSLTRPLLPAAPLIGLRPLFDGAVDEGGTAGFEAIALGPDLAPTDLAAVDWTLSRIETDFQWYEADGVWNYEPITRRSRVANGTLDLTATAPRASTCRSTGAATSSPSPPPTAATSPPASASTPAGAPPAPAPRPPTSSTLSLDREAYAPGDTARARVVARTPASSSSP